MCLENEFVSSPLEFDIEHILEQNQSHLSSHQDWLDGLFIRNGRTSDSWSVLATIAPDKIHIGIDRMPKCLTQRRTQRTQAYAANPSGLTTLKRSAP